MPDRNYSDLPGSRHVETRQSSVIVEEEIEVERGRGKKRDKDRNPFLRSSLIRATIFDPDDPAL